MKERRFIRADRFAALDDGVDISIKRGIQATSRARRFSDGLEPWIDWLALQREDTENTLVDTP